MKRLAIIGSGDLAIQIAHHAVCDKHYQIAGCFDDFIPGGEYSNELLVLGNIDSIQDCFNKNLFDELIIGIGYKHMELRKHLFNRYSSSIPFATLIHPSCVIDPTSVIGKGSVLYSGCIISMGVEIKENVLIYDGSIIAHDSVIGKHSILSPGIKISGFSNVGECVNLGTGTILVNNISIADFTRTGAGAVVVKNIEQPGLYLGCPAKLHNA